MSFPDERPTKAAPDEDWFRYDVAAGFAFCGLLIGLLPLWNSAVFLSAFVVFGTAFLLLPLRRYLLIFAAVTAVVCLPQLYFMTSGDGAMPEYPMFRLGYVIVDPTLWKIIEFLGFSMGFKWLIIAFALICLNWRYTLVFITFTTPLILSFLVQFSPELVANHKFTNIWLVLANVFVAYGLWRLWNLRVVGTTVLSRVLTVVLALGIAAGGIIDFFPIWNEGNSEHPYKDDRLIEWIRANTNGDDVFLSKHYVGHDILMAGRKIFYGHQLFAWSAGLVTLERDRIYARMFSERVPELLINLLNKHKIRYVAIDNQLRDDKTVENLNEATYRKYFEKVYDDVDHLDGNIQIYVVPPDASGLPEDRPRTVVTLETVNGTPTVYAGGVGSGNGLFMSPRGVATDAAGNIYIADTGNARIQKFDESGAFVTAFGVQGTNEGEIKEPNGLAIDRSGNIYITDAVNHKLVKFGADGTFLEEWTSMSGGGFYGPRDIAFGPENKLYIIDQGRNRIVQFDTETKLSQSWGDAGGGAGQFHEPTGITVGNNSVIVADMGNHRIQVFDLNGVFVTQWQVPSWEGFTAHFPDVAYDKATELLYVTDGKTNEILAFKSDGTPLPGYKLQGNGILAGPSSITVREHSSGKTLLVLNNTGANVTMLNLESKKIK